MKTPYRSISELNIDNDINKNLTVTQEKTKSRTYSKYKLSLKESNKSVINKNKNKLMKVL
jgi:hypothetical protein